MSNFIVVYRDDKEDIICVGGAYKKFNDALECLNELKGEGYDCARIINIIPFK